MFLTCGRRLTLQHNLLVSIISVPTAILLLLSSHYTYHALGYLIIKTLLALRWMRKSNLYIRGAHNELILVTVKLLIGISEFAGGKEEKSLVDAFKWEIKSLPKLLSLRRRGKTYHNHLAKPDIRSLYILFLLSFLDAQTQRKIHSSNIGTHFLPHSKAFLKIIICSSVMFLKRYGFISGPIPRSNELLKLGFSMKRRFPISLKGRVRRMILWNMYPRTSYTISCLLSPPVLGLVSVSKIVDGILVTR